MALRPRKSSAQCAGLRVYHHRQYSVFFSMNLDLTVWLIKSAWLVARHCSAHYRYRTYKYCVSKTRAPPALPQVLDVIRRPDGKPVIDLKSCDSWSAFR